MKSLYITINSIIDQTHQSYQFSQSMISIGRTDNNDIILSNKLISSKHAIIEWKDNGYWITDNNSQQGIFDTAQNKISSIEITENLDLFIGVFEFKFSYLAQQDRDHVIKQKVIPTPPASTPQTLVKPSHRKTLFQTLFQPNHINKKIFQPKNKKNTDFKWKPPLDLYRSKAQIWVVIAAIILSISSYYLIYNDKKVAVSMLIKHNSEKYNQALSSHKMEISCQNCHSDQIPEIKLDNCLTCHDDYLQNQFHKNHQELSKNELFFLKSQSEKSDLKNIKFLKNIVIDKNNNVTLNCIACHSEHQDSNVSNQNQLEEIQKNTYLLSSAKCMSCHPDRTNLKEGKTFSFFKNRHQSLQKNTKLPLGLELKKVSKPIGMNISAQLNQIHQLHENIPGLCVGCHANEKRNGPQENIAGQCFRCHNPYQGIYQSSFELSSNLNQTECVDCHHYSEDLNQKLSKTTNDHPKKIANKNEKEQFVLSSDDVAILNKIQSEDKKENHQNTHIIEPIMIFVIFILLIAISTLDRPKPDVVIDEEKKEIKQKKLIHILEEPCVGCGECVTACPYDVLALYKSAQGKKIAKVVNFDSCNECDACVKACKPEALTRRMPNEALPMISRPDLDSNYMTSLEGVYLIGEASGKSLVRNANNLGAKVIQHILHLGVNEKTHTNLNVDYDVVIIGAGPAGLSAGISALQANLKHLVIEKSDSYLNILKEAYPAGKEIQNQPIHTKNIGPLPMDHWDIMSKEEFLKSCDQLMKNYPVNFHFKEEVKKLSVIESGKVFRIETSQGSYTAHKVIIALGTRGNPRKLSCIGNDLPHVKYHLADPKVHQNQDLIVVGGGNSALEAAVALAKQSSNRVSLVYRGANFNKTSSEKNINDLESLEKLGKLKVYRETNPIEIKQKSVILKSNFADVANVEIVCEAIYCMLGAEAPNQWLQQQGIKYVDKPQGWSPSSSDDVSFF